MQIQNFSYKNTRDAYYAVIEQKKEFKAAIRALGNISLFNVDKLAAYLRAIKECNKEIAVYRKRMHQAYVRETAEKYTAEKSNFKIINFDIDRAGALDLIRTLNQYLSDPRSKDQTATISYKETLKK